MEHLGVHGDRIMLLAVELIITLLIGFVLGRIWQIRQQILLDERIRERFHENSSADGGRPAALAFNLHISPASAKRRKNGTALPVQKVA